MKARSIRHGIVALAVCAALLGLTGCGGGSVGSHTEQENGVSGQQSQSQVDSSQTEEASAAEPSQMEDAQMQTEPGNAAESDAPQSTGEEERSFYGRVVSVGDALYTPELQMNGKVILGTSQDLEQWQAAINGNPDALYIDCRVETGFDLTREQMEAVLSALRGMEPGLWASMEEMGPAAAASAYTVAALDQGGYLLWQVQIAGGWVLISYNDLLRCFVADDALDLMEALSL